MTATLKSLSRRTEQQKSSVNAEKGNEAGDAGLWPRQTEKNEQC